MVIPCKCLILKRLQLAFLAWGWGKKRYQLTTEHALKALWERTWGIGYTAAFLSWWFREMIFESQKGIFWWPCVTPTLTKCLATSHHDTQASNELNKRKHRASYFASAPWTCVLLIALPVSHFRIKWCSSLISQKLWDSPTFPKLLVIHLSQSLFFTL